MRLADARWPEQQYVLLTFQEGERRQLAQLAFVDRRLEGEVELVQALVVGEVRPLRLQPDVPGVLGLTLGFKRLFEEVEIRQVLRGSLFRDGLIAVGQMREAQPQHMVQQAFRLKRHGPPPHRTRYRSTADAAPLRGWRSAARHRDPGPVQPVRSPPGQSGYGSGAEGRRSATVRRPSRPCLWLFYVRRSDPAGRRRGSCRRRAVRPPLRF